MVVKFKVEKFLGFSVLVIQFLEQKNQQKDNDEDGAN